LREAKGIGTPATRAEIIAGLKAQGFLAAQGRNIVPTQRGLALFEVLRRAAPALVDPGVTAQFECLLDDVMTGRQAMLGAIDAVCDSARGIIRSITARGDDARALPDEVTHGGDDRPPTAAMKKFAASRAKSIGHPASPGLHPIGGGMSGVPQRARTPAAFPARHQAIPKQKSDPPWSGIGNRKVPDSTGRQHARGERRDPRAMRSPGKPLGRMP